LGFGKKQLIGTSVLKISSNFYERLSNFFLLLKISSIFLNFVKLFCCYQLLLFIELCWADLELHDSINLGARAMLNDAQKLVIVMVFVRAFIRRSISVGWF
jgi:hypothetical protein